MIDQAIFNRAPLAPNTYSELPVGAVKPKGWLLETEKTFGSGITGHLPEVWESVGNSVWMGGDGENWERGPYYLDGLIPLAWQLNDERLKEIAMRFIEWILSSQEESGFFGPKDNPDWWPRMVALKCLKQYFEATGDKRVLPFMAKYFEYEYKTLDEQPLGLWAIARAGENIEVAQWLYNITGAKGLLKLCDKLLSQSIDWTGYYHTFPDSRDQKRAFPWALLEPMLKESSDPWSAGWQQHQRTHVVNQSMALKTPVLDHTLHGGIKQGQAFFVGWEKLMKHHGVASGMFTGDEHLSGTNPTQGTETCAVVEALYSLETIMGQLGDAKIGDIWERIAYNALPAAFTKDSWAHQYDQQVNQITAGKGKYGWYNNKNESNMFGLEPNFGCCTANLHQGYPKFTAHLWYAVKNGGLCAMTYAPCEVKWKVGDARVQVTVEGNYPYTEDISIIVKTDKAARFPVHLRVPAWTEDAYAKIGEEIFVGEAGKFLVIEREWDGQTEIVLHISREVRVEKYYHQSVAVVCGAVLYALPLGEKWEYKGAEMPLSDRIAEAVNPWNYALLCDEGFELSKDGKTVTATGFALPDWKEKDGVTEPIPVLPKQKTESVKLNLVPYAEATLRIAQFPQGRK